MKNIQPGIWHGDGGSVVAIFYRDNSTLFDFPWVGACQEGRCHWNDNGLPHPSYIGVVLKQFIAPFTDVMVDIRRLSKRTQHQISVELAYQSGKKIEPVRDSPAMYEGGPWEPAWDWGRFDYRIITEPRIQLSETGSIQIEDRDRAIELLKQHGWKVE